MSSINNNNNDYSSLIETINNLNNVLNSGNINPNTATGGLPGKNDPLLTISFGEDLPALVIPSSGALSLETLVDAIGFDQRKISCQEGINNLEAKAKEVKETNAQELEELAKQLEEMDKKKVLNGFLKAFQVIGTIIGAIAAAATIAVGAITCNPLLIAGGVMAAIAVVDSVMSLASDGKVSMMAGFTELGKCMGMSEEDAAWFGMGMQLAFSVATIAVSCGASFASGAATMGNSALQAASKTIEVLNTAQKIMNIANGINTVALGSAQIAGSVMDYKIADSQATQKELEAILERLQQAIDNEKALLEAKMERANELLQDVSEIVDNCNQTNTAILTTTPSFA